MFIANVQLENQTVNLIATIVATASDAEWAWCCTPIGFMWIHASEFMNWIQ